MNVCKLRWGAAFELAAAAGSRKAGGEGGIRTHGGLSPTAVFKDSDSLRVTISFYRRKLPFIEALRFAHRCLMIRVVIRVCDGNRRKTPFSSRKTGKKQAVVDQLS